MRTMPARPGEIPRRHTDAYFAAASFFFSGLSLEVGIASRDEDIILEIPGENEAQFAEIRDIVSQTARLEFKMVDDDHDFFEQFASSTDVPTGLRFERENAPLGSGKAEPGSVRCRSVPHRPLARTRKIRSCGPGVGSATCSICSGRPRSLNTAARIAASFAFAGPRG